MNESHFENGKPPVAYRARWVVPVDAPPIENGVVLLEDSQIVFVGPADQWSSFSAASAIQREVIDTGDCAIIPGLINAHTHLEFSDLAAPLGTHGIEFTQWVRLVVKSRIDAAGQGDAKSKAIRAGIEESAAAGVVYLGEVATAPFDPTAYRSASVALTVFHEFLGRDTAMIEERMQTLRQFLSLAEFAGAAGKGNDGLPGAKRGHLSPGISPHAPYSVGDRLFDDAADLARDSGVPVAMHLAETRQELELLHRADGPFVQMLKDFGAWFPDTHRKGSSVMDYLEKLSRLPRSLVVHGNYLTDAEIRRIANHRDSMHVVYCPRTHHFFDHEPYPLSDLLDAGINVALGTDSRASNPDLNLMNELRFVRECFPEIPAAKVLELGTICAANALGISDRYGSISAGKTNLVNVVQLPEPGDWCSIFDPGANVIPISRFQN